MPLLSRRKEKDLPHKKKWIRCFRNGGIESQSILRKWELLMKGAAQVNENIILSYYIRIIASFIGLQKKHCIWWRFRLRG